MPIELIKAAGDGMFKEITAICNKIRDREEWSSNCGKSIFHPQERGCERM